MPLESHEEQTVCVRMAYFEQVKESVVPYCIFVGMCRQTHTIRRFIIMIFWEQRKRDNYLRRPSWEIINLINYLFRPLTLALYSATTKRHQEHLNQTTKI